MIICASAWFRKFSISIFYFSFISIISFLLVACLKKIPQKFILISNNSVWRSSVVIVRTNKIEKLTNKLNEILTMFLPFWIVKLTTFAIIRWNFSKFFESAILKFRFFLTTSFVAKTNFFDIEKNYFTIATKLYFVYFQTLFILF